MNGQGSTVVVKPGEWIHLTLIYYVSNSSNCSGCRQQIVIGVADQPQFCAYDGIPLMCPDHSNGEAARDFPAPGESGTYPVYAANLSLSSCSEALPEFWAAPKTQIGTIVVM